MKRRILFSISIFFYIFQFSACLFENLPAKYASSFIGKERNSFWVIKNMGKKYGTDPSAWKKISVVKKYDGKKAVIYIDRECESLKTLDEIKELGKEFDSKIYGSVTDKFSTPFDLDENKKVIIVLVKLPVAYSGYFFNLDFYSDKYIKKFNEQEGTCLHSNEGDIFYLNVTSQITDPLERKDHFHGTAAHEFMHLVSASHSILNGQGLMQTWIEEGLAEAANHIYLEETINIRVDYYNNKYNQKRIKSGYPLLQWGESHSDQMLNYSLSYLFFQFLYNHAADKSPDEPSDKPSGKEKLFKNIIASPYADYRAIVDAMGKDDNLSKWGSTGTERFQKLLLRFYATNAGVEGEKYGYGDEFYSRGQLVLDDTTNQYSPGSLELSLEVGAGVAVDLFNRLTDLNKKCIYLSVDENGENENFGGTNFSENGKLIAVNYSSYIEGGEKISFYQKIISGTEETNPIPQNETLKRAKRKSSFNDNSFAVDLINSRELIEDLNNFELTQ